MWLRRMTALLLCGGSGLAAAAGISCDKAANTIDQTICRSHALTALDTQMGQAYADATQRARTEEERLLRDQRHWLAERNELIFGVVGEKPSPAKARWMEQALVRFYQDRIAYLSHVFGIRNDESPLLNAIANKLSKDEVRGYPEDAWSSLGGNGSIFRAPNEEETDAKNVSSKIPVDPGRSLTEVINDLGDNADMSQITLAMLPEIGTGGMYQMGGTLHCVSWSLFTWRGRTLQALETPQILQQNCWTTRGTIIAFQGATHALTFGLALTDSTIQTQAWVGGKWSAPHRLEVRYDYELQKPQGFCAKDNPDCSELTALANTYVTRFDRSRIPELLTSTSLSEKEAASYAAMLGAMGDQERAPPTFGQTIDDGYSDFGDGTITFPVRWHGEVLLGKIGRASIGWRIGDNWLAGLWRLSGQALEPVVGIRVPVVRTGYLHSAIVP